MRPSRSAILLVLLPLHLPVAAAIAGTGVRQVSFGGWVELDEPGALRSFDLAPGERVPEVLVALARGALRPARDTRRAAVRGSGRRRSRAAG